MFEQPREICAHYTRILVNYLYRIFVTIFCGWIWVSRIRSCASNQLPVYNNRTLGHS